ncbi:hypothetical protein [Bacillus sp. AY2-1]|nr:hypothetical protein [Bacillus sp. AY2-1]
MTKKREQFALFLHLVKLRKILPVDIGNDLFYDEIKSWYILVVL